MKKVKLIELLEEKQTAAERKAKALIRELQLEVAENHRMSTKLDELLKTEDNFTLIQELLTSTASLPNSNQHFTMTKPSLLQVDTMRRAVNKIEETLSEQMEKMIREVSLADEEETAEGVVASQLENLPDDELGKIQKQYAVNVTLDPNTSHPSLIISEDRKQVRDAGAKRNVPDNPLRFDSLHYVLGNEEFSSGMSYFEVKVEGQKGWEVGMVRESISKKGTNLSLSPNSGCWTLGSYSGRCQANTCPPVILSLSKQPQKIGVFVDYEGGVVSFYDVDARTLIHSFTQCAFTVAVPLMTSFSNFLFYPRTAEKTKIYPIFRPSAEDGSDSIPLHITPVRYTERK